MIGFKVAAYNNKVGAYSIYGGDKFPISTKYGSVVNSKDGFYLGTSPEFVLQHYSGLTDDNDILLIYEYDPSNVINKYFNMEEGAGEIKVKKAKLINIHPIKKINT